MTLTLPETGSTAARDALLERYADRIAVNPDLDRALVSFQGNKGQPFYGWFKYKEGFSARLVEYFLGRLGGKPGVLLDPFAGAGAALFASRDLGWNALGIELLPVGCRVVEARLAAERVDPRAFAEAVGRAKAARFGARCPRGYAFPHVAITRGAFPPGAERELGGYLAFCDGEAGDPAVADLLRFAAIAVLEDVSYTRKDGQYLRWDPRCGRPGVRGRLDKGRLPSLREAVVRQLERMARDLAGAGPRAGALPGTRGRLDLRQGSCLGLLPRRDSGSVDFVLTSPPYCNRYDYTRTYALELALLGLTDAGVKDLRQRMLSCTVENKEKRGQLRAAWEQAGRAGAFEAVEREFAGHEALQEVLGLLEAFRVSGKLNNSNIARMVRNYFYEMCFVVYELARVLAPGGRAVMVNDDVRYAGEEVPVDLILSDFAAAFGLRVRHIWTLPRGKGNSSQQMGAHGRRELRKCVYVWEKPRR